MARYSLFVLKVPLNTKQTNKQNNLNRLLIGQTDLTHSYLLNKEQSPY